MFNIFIKVITNWQVLVISAILGTIMFYMRYLSKRKQQIKAKPNTVKQKTAGPKEEPGKLYVPDSTYEMLKKEKRIHPPK